MMCPKCGKNMTNTTDTKAYCMKCDILIHTPSGVAFTGDPAKDKFIGSIAMLLAPSREGEATLGPDTLILNWKEGNEARIEKIAYPTMTGIDLLERKLSEISTQGSVAGAVLGAGVWGLAEMYLSHAKTLKISTQQKKYEVFVPEAEKWADRLQGQMATSHTQGGGPDFASRTEPARTSDKAQPIPPTKFCRECGASIPRDSKYCKECGASLA
jgi:hypothetical protein